MAKTYPLKALWPLLPFEVAAAPLLATLDAYGGGLVKYAVSQDGIWLFYLAQPLTVHESENLTGFHPADLVPKQIDGVEGYFYAMQGGAPLLPLPFTKDQLIEFEKRMAGLIGSCIERGDDTDAWIADLEKENPDAAELARGIHSNQWPFDLADIVETKKEGVAKPRFRLSDGIEQNASTMAFKSAYDEAQRQTDMLKSMGITSDLLKQIDLQREMEKLVGASGSSMANAAYMDEIKRSQDMLRIANPNASELAADALGRQLASTVGLGTAADAYLVSQATARVDMEKLIGGSFSAAAQAISQHEALGYVNTVADAYRQGEYIKQTELEKSIAMVSGSIGGSMGLLDRAGCDTTLGSYHHPTAKDMFEQMERERLEETITDSANRETFIEFTPPPYFDHQAAENRRLDREREHRLETERQAVFVRLEAEQEFAARNKAAAPEATTQKAKPVQRSAAQDAAILATLKAMDVDPLAVPKNPPGKPGTKAKVRTALEGDALFTGATVFDKAWERLTTRGEIVISA